MSNPIDRALANAHRKLDNQNSRQCAEDFDRERRQILTDLAAEMFAEGVMAPCKCEAKARLAAVVERVQKHERHEGTASLIDDTLALARGESQSIASRNDTKEEELHESGTPVGGSTPLQSPAPAAPLVSDKWRCHAVLADLVAEIRRDQYEMDLTAMIDAQRELDEVHALLAAVREAKDRLRGSILAEELDAILDGKEAEDR